MVNGEVIAGARTALGISQKALGEAVGVGELTVWRWENKPTKGLDYFTARRLAGALGLTEESLFVHEEEENTPDGACALPARHNDQAPTADSAKSSAVGAR